MESNDPKLILEQLSKLNYQIVTNTGVILLTDLIFFNQEEARLWFISYCSSWNYISSEIKYLPKN